MDKTTEALRLKQIADRAFTSEERANAQDIIRDLEAYILPNQSSTITVTNSRESLGRKTTSKIYDSTAPTANRDLSSILFSTMCPPTKKWSKLRHRIEELNDVDEVSKWFDTVNDLVHKEFGDSNLYTYLGEGFASLTALGSMALLHEEKPTRADGTYGGVRFSDMHVSQIAWGENLDGIVDRLYRKHMMAVSQVVERWPDTCPDEIKEQAELDPTCQIIIYHCITPRPRSKVKPGLAGAEYRPYGSYFFDETTATMLEEDGYYEFPAHILRFSKLPGETMGRGPGHIALPDIKTLNDTIRDTLVAQELAINPTMYTTARNILGNKMDRRPGGITYVQRLDNIKWDAGSARFDVAQVAAERLIMSIRQIYMLDKLLLPPRQETGEMSAYEVSRRVEEAQRVLGPVPSRIEQELLKPLLLRQIQIMLRAGALPPIPAVMEGIEIDLDIVLVSQLARAQSIEEVQAIQQGAQLIGVLAQINPDALDLMNVDEAGRSGMRILGVPESSIAGLDVIEQKREARAQQQQQMMEAEMNLKNADAASKVPQQ